MDKAYEPQKTETAIYALWEEGGYFTPKIDPPKKPFTIILPPPNANADLHLGHAMYVVEDIMIRYHRMKGDPTLWLPGADHAGFETQYVYEKELAKQGKSRFDFDRETLYKNIWNFVHENRGKMENQLRRLGFSLDWSRNIFTLDPKVVATVYKTFKKLYDDGLVYRSAGLVNYCTKCGTSFSDLEVKHVEQIDPLYYLKYGPFILATVRPETKFGDTAVAVNPKDKRYKSWIGKKLDIEGLIGKFTVKVISDDVIDPKFGTGIAKVTPAHDMTDFEIAKRHNLAMKQVIGFDGKLTDLCGAYAGMKVKAARAKIVEDLKAHGMIDHIDESYTHVISTCYKCGSVLEPLPLPQWYIKIKPLATQAIKAIKDKKITFVPKRFEKRAVQWITDFHDWNISRQLVWGIQIPAWRCLDCSNLTNSSNLTNDGWIVTEGEPPNACPTCGGSKLTQDPDTFDTWFSSGQWPFATLTASDKRKEISDKQEKPSSLLTSHFSPISDLNYFYPTSVMETGYDILPWWVCRMAMLGLYVTSEVPFQTVYLHGLVRDGKGQKMSKSKGNVINPLKMIDQYGADALRFALVFGTAAGNDQALSEDKIRGMRNFANKIWNAARFVTLLSQEKQSGKEDAAFNAQMKKTTQKVTSYMEKYNFNAAAELLYESFWHWYCDWAIEQTKVGEIKKSSLEQGLVTYLKLLHPFMPFVTEKIWKTFGNMEPLIISPWPNTTVSIEK